MIGSHERRLVPVAAMFGAKPVELDRLLKKSNLLAEG